MATISEILTEAERLSPGSVKSSIRPGWKAIDPPLKVLEFPSGKEFHITRIDVSARSHGSIRVKEGGFRLAEDFVFPLE